MKFQTMYKCQVCGDTTLSSNSVEFKTMEDAKEFFNKMMYFHNNNLDRFSDVPFQLIHSCYDGSIGLSVLCGLKHTKD